MKVLIIGMAYKWIGEGIANALNELGYDARLYDDDWGIIQKNYIQRIKHSLLNDDKEFIMKEKDKDNKKIVALLDDFKPDVMFVIKGNRMKRSTLERMHGKIKTIVWLTDSYKRLKEVEECIDLYDYVLTFEPSDLISLSEINIPGSQFMGYVDTSIYKDLGNPRDIDILFVGAMYQNRTEILDRIASDFPGQRCEFYGKYTTINKPDRYFRYMTNRLCNRVYMNKSVNSEKVNELYSRSKINLNIHHEQSVNGWNSKLCEVLGTNSFQICNYSAAIDKEFCGCLETYKDYEQLKCLISYYLSHEAQRTLIAQTGYEYVMANHTLKKRVKELVRTIERVVNG